MKHLNDQSLVWIYAVSKCRHPINANVSKHQVVADIQREFNDDGFEKETSTHSAMVYHLLNAGDKVKVKFNKVC